MVPVFVPQYWEQLGGRGADIGEPKAVQNVSELSLDPSAVASECPCLSLTSVDGFKLLCWFSLHKSLSLRILTGDSPAAAQLPLPLPWTALDVSPSAPKVFLGSRGGTKWRDLKDRELSERPCKELQVRAVCPLQQWSAQSATNSRRSDAGVRS